MVKEEEEEDWRLSLNGRKEFDLIVGERERKRVDLCDSLSLRLCRPLLTFAANKQFPFLRPIKLARSKPRKSEILRDDH